jgi:formylglycine-generating enzyme required for sulfatase activity
MAAFPGTRKEWIAKERPAHRVEISHPFYLSKYETTLGQFKTFVAETGYKTDAEKDWKGGQGVSEKGELTRNVKFNWRDWGTVQTDNTPAVNVSDADAIEFCKWLSGKEGKTYRLPTEAEWEYTCRAGTITQFYNGDDPKQLQKIANFGDFPKNNRMYTLPVGRLAPNNFGLYDMSGNVEEWCADLAAPDNYYDRSPEIDPEGPEHGMYRIARGGDWGSGALWCRSALRRHHDQRRGAAFIGFRVACAAASGRGTVGSSKQASGTPAGAPSSAIAIKERGSSKSNIATTVSKISGRPFLVRGEWTIENDELVQPTLARGDDLYPILVFGDETLSNYDLTVEVKKTGGGFAMGPSFHWLGPGHHRELRFVGNEKIDYVYVYSGKFGADDSKMLKYSSNRWYTVKIEVRGEIFRAYVDGVLQFEKTDPRFTHGRIAVSTWNAAARFRRIKVSDPQGKVLFEGLPELPASNKMVPKANIGDGARLLTAGETAAKSAQQQWAERSKTPVISTNSRGIKLALIPPGEFPMGSPNSEKQRRGNEQQHRVRITKPFYLGVYEVTQSQFEQVMGRNPSEFLNSGGQAEAATGVDTSRYPVESVTWYDAVEFCNKLSEKEGRRPYYRLAGIERKADGSIKEAKVSVAGGGGYRLPTEAQWEYACRAGTTTPFNFGTASNGAESNCDGKAPYGTEEQGPALGSTVPVGSYRPNAFGLYDMHGNVWEWCWDVYDEAYYKHSPESDPAGGTL